MSKDVFLSYSSKDANAAGEICRLLEERGVTCWIAPRDVIPGRHYAEEIMDALDDACALVLVLSDNSNDSRHVKNEIEVAVSHGKPIFPVRIKNVEPAKALRLLIAGSQWVDAWMPPIEQKIDQLAGAILTLKGHQPLTPEPPVIKPDESRLVPSGARVSRKRIAVIAAALAIGVVAIWLQSTRTSQRSRSGTIIIPSNPAGDSANASPTEEALAKLEKLKGLLSDQIERREFDDAASTISAILAIDRDNREALDAQAVIDRVKGTAVTREIDVPGNILAASFLPDGRRVIVGCSGVIGTGPTAHPEAIIGWDADTGQKLYDTAITGSALRANCMAFSKDGRTALTGGYFGLNHYNVESGQKLNHFDAGIVNVTCFLPGEKRALVGGSELELWDLELNTVIRRYQGHTDRVQALALTPDGKRAVSAAADATIRLWELSSSAAVWSAEGPKVNFQSLAITPDARYVLSGGDKVIRVLELDTGREITRLKGHKGYTLSLAISSDGRRALSGGTDNIARLWDLSTAAQIRAYRVKGEWTGSVAFSPDGRRGLLGTAFGLEVVSLPD